MCETTRRNDETTLVKKKKNAKNVCYNVFSRERLTLCNSQSPFTFADIAGSEVGLTAMRSAMSDAAAAFCAAVASSPRPEAAASATMRFLSDAAASPDEG